MSHIGSYAAGLSATVRPDLMLKTLIAIAAELKGTLIASAQVKDYMGRLMGDRCTWTLFCKDMPNGLGIKLEQGKPPQFVADTWSKEKQFTMISNKIKQVYIALAAAEAAKTLGYPVQGINQVKGNIHISLKVGA